MLTSDNNTNFDFNLLLLFQYNLFLKHDSVDVAYYLWFTVTDSESQNFKKSENLLIHCKQLIITMFCNSVIIQRNNLNNTTTFVLYFILLFSPVHPSINTCKLFRTSVGKKELHLLKQQIWNFRFEILQLTPL